MSDPCAKILVVDDEQHVLATLQAILREDGYEVETAPEASTVLDAIETGQYDLVLTDLKMPDIDGMAVLAQVQKTSPSTVTIMMTGYGSVDSAVQALQLGAFDYLLKPVAPLELKYAVRRSLERKRLSEIDSLYRVNQAITATLDGEQIAREVEQAAERVLRIRSARLITFEHLLTGSDEHGLNDLFADTAVRLCLESGQAVSDTAVPGAVRDWADAANIRSFCLVPGISNGKLICALLAHNGQENFHFHFSSLRFLQALASKSALVLANATMFSEIQQKNSDLEAANRKLRELDRLKSQFLSVATHELRTPLTIIMGYNAMLADELKDRLAPEEQELLTESVSACSRLIRLVNSMLDITQIEAGKMRMNFTAADLREIVSNTVSLFERDARSKRLGLSMELPDNLPRIQLDPDRMEQVLVNLIGNSMKFTEPGGVIRVSARYSSDREVVEVSVQDSGVGIAPEDQDLIFDEFAQAQRQARKRQREGSGLGLAIAKRIVQAHSGEISLFSAPGKGSTFTCTLPVRRPQANSAPVALA